MLLRALPISLALLVALPRAAAAQQDPGTAMPEVLELGIGPRFMPGGWFEANGRTNGAIPALGLAMFLDYGLSPFVSVGVAPELTLNVIPDVVPYQVGVMFGGSLRISVRYPNASFAEPYAVATGGYATIRLADAGDAASGFTAGALGGVRFRFTDRHAAFVEAGIQMGFERRSGAAYAPTYVITGAGWQIRL